MTTDYRTIPVDAVSHSRLAASGLELALIDTSDAAAFTRWLESETRGFHGPQMNEAEIDWMVSGLAARRSTGVFDETAADAAYPVATVSSWPLQLTVPGERGVGAWAISAVTVSPTHRRRGVARALLEAELRTAHTLGLPLAALTVSEATIYHRYGFAPAAMSADLQIETARARWTGAVASGRLHAVSPKSIRDEGLALVERVRLDTPGQVQFDGNLWIRLIGIIGDPEAARKLRVVRYDDLDGVLQGFAIYTVTETSNNFSAHTLELKYLVSATDDAYSALWTFMLDMDLVNSIVAPMRPVDEPLTWQVADPRAVKTTERRDHLWVRVLDVPAALEARTYNAEGDFVLDVSDPLGFAEGRFLLSVDASGAATVTPLPADASTDADSVASIALSVNDLGAIYLGATPVSTLVRAGRIVELTPDAANRFDSAFRSTRAPWLSIWF